MLTAAMARARALAARERLAARGSTLPMFERGDRVSDQNWTLLVGRRAREATVKKKKVPGV